MLKAIGRIIYLILAGGCIVAGINIFSLDPSLIVMAYITLHSVCYVFSLPLVLRIGDAVGRRAKKKSRSAAIIATVLALYLVAPILLAASFVATFISFVRSIGRKKAPLADYTDEERREIYHHSAALALRSILDPTTAGDVVLDDGVTTMALRQVATVECLGGRYALLSPIIEGDDEPRAYAYEIRPRDGGDGELTLIPVVDERIYSKVYEAYQHLARL